MEEEKDRGFCQGQANASQDCDGVVYLKPGRLVSMESSSQDVDENEQE